METFIPRVDIDNVSCRNTPFYVSFNLRRPTSIYDARRGGETWRMKHGALTDCREFVIFIVSLSVETRANIPFAPLFKLGLFTIRAGGEGRRWAEDRWGKIESKRVKQIGAWTRILRIWGEYWRQGERNEGERESCENGSKRCTIVCHFVFCHGIVN